LRKNGLLLVDVPQSETYYNRRRESLEQYGDGWLIRHGSRYAFYKSFLKSELDGLLLRDGRFRISEVFAYSKHLIRLLVRAA
jgi:hypothetical protein